MWDPQFAGHFRQHLVDLINSKDDESILVHRIVHNTHPEQIFGLVKTNPVNVYEYLLTINLFLVLFLQFFRKVINKKWVTLKFLEILKFNGIEIYLIYKFISYFIRLN